MEKKSINFIFNELTVYYEDWMLGRGASHGTERRTSTPNVMLPKMVVVGGATEAQEVSV